MSYHEVQLIGHLGRDPEMRYTPSGQAVTNFSVAVNDNFTNSAGEKVERTAWIRVSAWGRMAEVCSQYLTKGRQVFVKGRLIFDEATGSPRVYQKNDGTYGASFEVNASTVRFLGRGIGQSDEGAGQQNSTEEEEIPF